MTAEEREAIRRRVNTATPGPWVRSQWGYNILTADRRISIVELRPSDPAYNPILDAEFIAHARTDVPALLDALEATERELRLARELLFRFAPLNSVIACFLWPDAECEKPHQWQLDIIRREVEEKAR